MNKKLILTATFIGITLVTLAWLLSTQREKLPTFFVDKQKPYIEAIGQKIQVLSAGKIILSESMKVVFPENNTSKGFKRRFQGGFLSSDLEGKKLSFPESLAFYLDGLEEPNISTLLNDKGFNDYLIKTPTLTPFAPGAHTITLSIEISGGVYQNKNNQTCFGLPTFYTPGNGVSKLEVTLKAENPYAVNAYILEAGNLDFVVATRTVNDKNEVLLDNKRDTTRVQKNLLSDSIVYTVSNLNQGERFMIEGCTQ